MGEQRRYKNQHVFLRGQAQRLNGPLAYQVIATPQTLSLISEQKSGKKANRELRNATRRRGRGHHPLN